MGCTVRELLERIDSRELSEWMAYDQINPPADSWLQTGLIVSALANLLGGGKRTYKPNDFMPRRKRVAEADADSQERREKSLLDRLFCAMRKRKAD